VISAPLWANGSDFLETWISDVQFANEFSSMHSLKGGKIGYFTYISTRQPEMKMKDEGGSA